MASESELLTKRAALLLNGFGYINIKPKHLTALEASGNAGIYDYILVGFKDKMFKLKFKDDGETKSWNLVVKESTDY